MHLLGTFSMFVQFSTQFVITWLQGCCFHVLQDCHSVAQGSVPSAPSCLALLTQGNSPGNEYCNKLLRHLIFVPGESMDDTPETRANLTLLPDRELAVLSPIVSVEGWAFCIRVWIQNRSIAEGINAFSAFFFIPHYSPSAPEIGVLFDFN